MIAPTLQAEGSLNIVTTGTLTLTLPAHQQNDILVCVLNYWLPNTAGAAAVIPNLTGWTKTGSLQFAAGPDGEAALFWRRADTNAESNPVFTRGASWDTGVDGQYSGQPFVIRGCYPSGNPWDDFQTSSAITAANGNVPAVTVSGTNRLVMQFFTATDDFTTAPTLTGWTAGTAVESTTGTDTQFMNWRKDNQGSSTTADATTSEAPATGAKVIFGVSFKPMPDDLPLPFVVSARR